MSGSDRFQIVWIVADRRQWSAIDHVFDFDDDGVEGVDVKDIASCCTRQVFFKHGDDPLPISAIMWSSGGNELPFETSFLELNR